MIGNYIKVASRNILKRKLYSFINAFGLSIGIAFCVLIFLFIEDEKSFDKFHVNREWIYRIEAKNYDTWQARKEDEDPYSHIAWLPMALGPALKDDLPEVEYMSRFTADNQGIFRYNEKVFTERFTYVDRDFFQMFTFSLIRGNKDKIMQDKNECVLTPEIAKKYFGDEDPIGKTVIVDNEGELPLTVTGIIEAPPANSSLQFQILLSQENRPMYEKQMKQWGNFGTPVFVQFVPDVDMSGIPSKLETLIQKYMGAKLEKWRKDSAIPVPEGIKLFELEYTNIGDIHLKKEVGWTKVSDPQYAFILGAIALLILLIACINYISLALTTSAARKTEVGVRKVVGALRNQLVWQFSFESVILALISMFIGIGLVILFLPFFNSYTGKEIHLTLLNVGGFIGVAFIITLTVGVVAGSYPALFLSNFKPVAVLKGRFTSRFQTGFTKPLVVLQFALSGFLIISSVIMYRQMKFVTTKDLGYNQEQVIVIPTQTGWNPEADKAVERFRARAQSEPSILSVSGTTGSFSQGYSRYGYKINGEQKSAYVYGIDSEYLNTLNIQLVQGRNFDAAIPSDSNALIVNEALVKDMKWTDPLNEYLNFKEDSVGPGVKIIGVVKDYHFLSLEKGIEPMLLSMDKKYIGHLVSILVKVKPDDIPASLDRIRNLWKEVSPDKPFDYTFLDEDVARQYETYKRWMSIMGLATGFAILISCLGLFGLAGINALNRTKEIGVRKVMGAELINIFILLNRQYIWLSLFAFVLAAPASWYIMNKWLGDFKYHIEMSWELFGASMASGLLIALLTVSYHAIKAAMVNPAETLKYE